MKKCPFCAEDIKDDAIFCKHCKKDLPKKSFIEKINDNAAKQKEEKAIKEKKYIDSLSEKEKKEYIKEKERKKSIKIIWWIAGMLSFVTFSYNNFICGIILLIAIWIHPRKNEELIKNRFKDWKKYKLRLGFSILAFLLSIIAYSAKQDETMRINYPEPIINITSSLDHQGDAIEYLLEFDVKEYETVKINNEIIKGEGGKFQKKIPLDNQINSIIIFAKNQYKESTKTINIKRDESEAERIEREKQEKEKEEKEAQAELDKISNQKGLLKKEIEGIKKFKGDTYRESVDSIIIEVALFSVYASLIEDANKFDDDEISTLAKQLEDEVRKLQIKEFPKMRKAYGDLVDTKMWEFNMDVIVKGSQNSTIEFVAGMFANNKNIKDMHLTISDILSQLRFDRVNYKWYEYDDDYTYFDFESPKDSEIIIIK